MFNFYITISPATMVFNIFNIAIILALGSLVSSLSEDLRSEIQQNGQKLEILQRELEIVQEEIRNISSR